MVLVNKNGRIAFQKISDKSVIGDGIQQLLRQYFWSASKKWEVVIFRSGTRIDTVLATIGSDRIYGNVENVFFRRYEFADVSKYTVNGEHLFGIDLFKVNHNNISDSGEVFAIKKSEPFVYLYKGNHMVYKLRPIE